MFGITFLNPGLTIVVFALLLNNNSFPCMCLSLNENPHNDSFNVIVLS